jgi:hypothetical protein
MMKYIDGDDDIILTRVDEFLHYFSVSAHLSTMGGLETIQQLELSTLLQ